MDDLTRLVIIVTVSILGEHSWSDGAPLDPFPLGTIGCLVSDVCDKGEICTNDSLFGSCQSQFSRLINGENRFELETDQIESLEEEIRRLIKAGFTWKDAYTQCTLQNTLVEFSRGRNFNRYLCEDALGVVSPDWSDDVNDEIAEVLLKLLDSGRFELNEPQTSQDDMIPPVPPTGLDILNSNKRDEIVKVHKYFDKSKGLLKRDPLFVGSGSSYNMLYPNERLNPGDLYYSRDMYRDDDEGYGPGYDTGYDPRREDSVFMNGDSPTFNLDTLAKIQQDRNLADYLSDLSYADQNGQNAGLEMDMGERTSAPVTDEYEPSVAELIDSLILSKEDQEALASIAQGDIKSDSLEPEQRQRLRLFIQTLLQLIMAESVDPDSFDTDAPTFDETTTEQSSDLFNELGQEEELPRLPDLTGPEEEEVATGVAEDSYGLTGQDGEVNNGEDDSMLRDSILRQALLRGEVPMDKKMADDSDEVQDEYSGNPVAGASLDEAFDRNTMYLELSRYLDEPDAIRFVNNITKILGLPPNMIQYRLPFRHHYIMLRVEDDPEGKWDGLKIGNAAMEHNEDLLKATNTTILKAGIGEPAYFQPPVHYPTEAKQNNRYVVLTFILVGTIAGVVLAVVITYLCKRHHRSKQKLAQLAANSDGNEASKDYQDLCRQRMQGKSSEKPEPLHAASRIGSVSENQVRSPSSRSSTSSWSEEPAATNMDISTGHIVLLIKNLGVGLADRPLKLSWFEGLWLQTQIKPMILDQSYMEDHLRNQDRLDQEWEAVSSYVADPSSTKVASDACNTRKNRYADILPYDHSRVVLSSSANVSNSDFINASYITDHDPRNPAYICTQGPLPHTVADFWQMIWEQGSVVIVMLTKLTENGTSLCHRYWPEEGSDLYHIYEVHLVSEHIWCDDYLVRSFYLKNLQTNETRTVTQFHFLTWPQLSVPASIKALLDFRRKVNKSFRGRSCPIVVHCSDGCGRSGTYCLIDMVLNKMAKGAKEIDMAATLEHIRDQRMSMVKTKEQFQFSLAAVAEEVHAILKALPQ